MAAVAAEHEQELAALVAEAAAEARFASSDSWAARPTTLMSMAARRVLG